ncbi:MAG: IclR family transcriptional regulator [Castellaniella sp.]|nr:IclR family transcriptional regulator [Castellaniella sp.]
MKPIDGSPTMARSSGAQAIHRAISVLRGIARGRGEGAALSVICRQTGLNKSTVHRLTAALIAEGLVQQDAQTRRYLLGAECYALGLVASDRFGLQNVVGQPVRRLAAETGDAAFFSVRQGTHALCLLREEGNYPLKSHVLQVGDRHPLGVGGGSLSMLAALDDAQVAHCLDQNMDDISLLFPGFTRQLLLELVHRARKRGYAVNPGLVLKGSWGVGVAVRDPDGQVLGAYSIATVETRMSPERESQLYDLLKKEADTLEKRLREQGLPRAFAT